MSWITYFGSGMDSSCPIRIAYDPQLHRWHWTLKGSVELGSVAKEPEMVEVDGGGEVDQACGKFLAFRLQW